MLWHDSCGYFLFMEDTVFMLKREDAYMVGPGHAKL